MIGIKEAVAAAKRSAGELYAEDELRQMRVEEFRLDESGDGTWRITLGWIEPAVRQVGGLAAFTTLEPLPRVYKVFEVDAQTGDVKSMQIRD